MKPVFVYTTNYCPYCVKAKNFLTSHGISYTEIDVTNDDESRIYLTEITNGRKTVPQIFFGGILEGKKLKNFDTHIGGCDDLVATSQETIKGLLK